MKFAAINLKNEEVTGTGVALADECIEGFDQTYDVSEGKAKYGESLSYLFTNAIEWVDGCEFQASNFELVFANSIKVVE